jgi:hypothetical protein
MLQDFLQTWEEMKDGRIQGQTCGQEILICQVLIHEQLEISNKGIIDDATNAIYDEAKTILKKIVGLHAFVENEQWNILCMKKEFHARFVALLQIIYQQKRLAYFSNKITITFDLVNRGQPMN